MENETIGELKALALKSIKSIKSVTRQGEATNKYYIEFDRPVPGVDFTKEYDSKEQALDVAFNALKAQRKIT